MCVHPGCVCVQGGVCVQECVCVQGGVPRGCVCRGVYPSMQWGRHPLVDRIKDRCKNISLPKTSFASGKNGNVFSTVI